MSLPDNTKGGDLAADLLATTQVELQKKAEQQIPKAWRPSERHNQDGSTEVTSQPYEGSYEASEASLLVDHGYSPETHMIVGGWRQSAWTAYKPKEYRRTTEDGDTDEDLGAFTFTAKAFKFKVAERPQGSRASDVEELIKALDTRGPIDLTEVAPVGVGVIYAIGDLQLGKVESPLSEVSDRVVKQIELAAGRIRHDYQKVEHLHIAFLGDCIEGVVSQGGALRWRTTLTMTEQVRVLQRLMMYAVEAFAPLCERLTVASVPGNHDRADSKDLQTRTDDSWAVQALVSVEDAIKFSARKDLEHAELYVPGHDEHSVVLDVGGLRVAHIHGDQHGLGKHWGWLSGQALGRQPEGDADLLLEGHWHHFQVIEQGLRTYICVPAMESESVWWKRRTGTPGNPGSLLIHAEDGRVGRIERLS